MSVTIQHRRLSKAAAERLLRGEPPAAGNEAWVAAVLAAAAAPRPSDVDGQGALAREHLAISAFRGADRPPIARSRRGMVARLVTVKAGIAITALLGLGGAAVAATTGNLPGSPPIGPWHTSAAPSSHRPRPTHLASRAPHETAPPGLWSLCHSYAARNPGQRRKALEDPGFKHLVDSAGSKDRRRVDAFCAKLLQRGPAAAASPAGGPTTHPGRGPKPHRPAASSTHPGKG